MYKIHSLLTNHWDVYLLNVNIENQQVSPYKFNLVCCRWLSINRTDWDGTLVRGILKRSMKVALDDIIINVVSHSDTLSVNRQAPLLKPGLALGSTDATVCPGRSCVCVFIGTCLAVRQMPGFAMSLKRFPDRQLVLPYLPTSMPPQLASNQYLLRPATIRYEPPPHLCSAT